MSRCRIIKLRVIEEYQSQFVEYRKYCFHHYIFTPFAFCYFITQINFNINQSLKIFAKNIQKIILVMGENTNIFSVYFKCLIVFTYIITNLHFYIILTISYNYIILYFFSITISIHIFSCFSHFLSIPLNSINKYNL